MSRRRAVVTGLGTVNPLANRVGETWKGLLQGRSGIRPLALFDASDFRVHFGGEVKDFRPEEVIEAKACRRLDRFGQFAMVAADEAVRDSGLELPTADPFRAGSIIGSGIGGLSEFESQHTVYREEGARRIGPFTIPKMMANSASGNVSIRYGLCGPNTAVSTACASAANAIADALRAIQLDQADVMITGGSEAGVTPMGLGGFCSSKALSTRNDAPEAASRPFDKGRDGFVLSEGCGILVLEEYEHARRRGAKIYAELLGAGSTADGYHITSPHPEGLGAAKAMEMALKDARVDAADVQYVNAHGTSTPLGDAAETGAIKKVFGPHAGKLMVSSTKSMVGHLLGASGGIETIVCCLTLKHGAVHPTINYETPDPDCDLDYVPNQAREVRVSRAITNSFGFGGHNCTLVLGAID